MATRRAHSPRHTRLPLATSPSSRLLSSHTFTLIASWRGQLLICTVVLVVGAIYFVVREPIRRWRRRQRERLSRALTAELLSMEKQDSRGGRSDDKERPSTSSKCLTTALPTPKRARERGREKRKEAKEAKKRGDSLLAESSATTSADATGVPTPSSSNMSPVLLPVILNESTGPSHSMNPGPSTTERESTKSSFPSSPSVSSAPIPPTITLEGTATDTDVSQPSASGSPSAGFVPQVTESPEAVQFALPSTTEIDLSIDGDDLEDHHYPRPAAATDQANPRSAHSSRQPSSTYSILPDDSYLPILNHQKKKSKRKSKARGGSESARSQVAKPPSLTAIRSLNMSSDDASSPRSVSANLSSPTPGSPSTPRRRRQTSVGGVPMTPALDLLLTNHERTIDHLRAEIGHAKAEESKAREDELRAREELRRSRAAEDRYRNDYERVRKGRDRMENEMRRLEQEYLHMRSRMEALYHAHTIACHRLREFEIARSSNQDGGPASAPIQTPQQMPPPSPFMPYPSPGLHIGFMQYGNSPVYGSPMPLQGFPLQPPVSPSPLRRADGTSTSDLAGPLTPGLGPPSATHSQLASPCPPDLVMNPLFPGPSSTSASGGTDSIQLSTGELSELRRLDIASSVLKKKTPTSESGDSNPASSVQASHPVSDKSSAQEQPTNPNRVAGLGISQLAGVASTFPSANGHRDHSSTPSKQDSMSTTSSCSSEASSAQPGRQILITPSNAELYHPSGKTSPPDESHVYVREPDSVDQSAETDTAHGQCAIDAAKAERLDPTGGPAASTDNGSSDYVPMFASLAHTPEQLAEIARMRESAIRNRERQTTHKRTTTDSDALNSA